MGFFRADSFVDALKFLRRIIICSFGKINSDILNCFKLPEIEFLLQDIPLDATYPYFIVVAFFILSILIILVSRNAYEKMENFKASEFDKTFGVSSVKVPFSGGSYKEINDHLKIALESNPKIKMILRCLDYNRILDPPDEMRYEESNYPRYLYDKIYYNDVKYILNKTVLFHDTISVIKYTRNGGMTTDFDTYSNWMDSCIFGKDAVDATYTREKKVEKSLPITGEDYKNITENVTRNVTNLADKYPETEFYLFFSPYSIYFWDSLNQAGALERQLEAEKYMIELLLQHENIHIFSFFTEYGMICDLNNYKDIAHYSENINSQILHWMNQGIHELTNENYKKYCESVQKFYKNYNYDSLFE